MTIKGAIAELKELMDSKTMPFYFKSGLEKVIETLEMDWPGIDIVRCSECKYYVYDYKGDWWSCSNRHGMGNSSFDDYCSHGERAEQKGESK